MLLLGLPPDFPGDEASLDGDKEVETPPRE